MKQTIYEVTGWPNTCPDEKWSEYYTTKELAEKAMAKFEMDYDNMSFEINTRTLNG